MFVLTWLRGLFAHRRGRLAATAVGVAVCVALLASIGAFLSSTTAKMTTRAAARVPVDWQVELQPGGSLGAVDAAVRRSPGVRQTLPVGYGATTGLSATTGGSTQRTGPGKVLGLPDGYGATFPGTLRTLAGSGSGVLLAQQTAANLHAAPGDTIEIGRAGAPPARVRVDGVVDLPAADSLFQAVGAPPGAQASAPPDNVVLLPRASFDALKLRGATTQLHAGIDHAALPGSPNAAYAAVHGRMLNLETRVAGGARVGDNLGTALDQARKDALYAQLLFLFLGLPGAILAGLVTATIASAGAARRRRDSALLRARGATARRLVGLALAEAAVAGVAGRGARPRGRAGDRGAGLRRGELRREHARRRPLGLRRGAGRADRRRRRDRRAGVA